LERWRQRHLLKNRSKKNLMDIPISVISAYHKVTGFREENRDIEKLATNFFALLDFFEFFTGQSAFGHYDII
jgi:hypothetical protein